MRQPWLPAAPSAEPADDFTPASATAPVGRAAGALVAAMLVLVVLTASELAIWVLDLPVLPGTDALVEAAGRLDDGVRALGLDRPHHGLREAMRAAEAARF